MVDIDRILKNAIEKEASDIHLIAGIKPTLRVCRELEMCEDFNTLSKEDMFEIYDYFIRGNLDKDKEFKETKRLDFSYEYEEYILRINISEADEVPIFTLRIFKNTIPSLETLRIPESVKKAINESQGLILVTGKTNSGKTTTINALINYINETQSKMIVTLESPVEYKHKCKKSIIVQKEVGLGQDVITYKDGINNSLREDCDVLVIGEIKDKQTMESAIEVAEAGHLVIGTLNTNSCASTIEKIISFYEKSDEQNIKFLLSSVLKLIISQRIIKNKEDKLVLIPEVMVIDDTVSGEIRKEKITEDELEEVIQNSLGNGSISFIDSIAQLFIEDIITLEQAKAQIKDKDIEILNRKIMQLKIKKSKCQ